MRTSGLVLDVYDDFRGDVVKSYFPSRDEVPERIKTARALSSEERESLPDESFALVMDNGDVTLRKFACIDSGNTALSVLYFLKTAHKLPEEAQKVAATNLIEACGWYGLTPPDELQKIASLMYGAAKGVGGAALSVAKNNPLLLLTAPAVYEGMKGGASEQLDALHAAETELGQMPPAHAFLGKHADVTGTTTAPLQYSGRVAPMAQVKTKAAEAVEPDVATPPKGEMPDKFPQSKGFSLRVDVSNKEPPKVIHEKKAEYLALRDRYPIDSYAQIKQAQDYFLVNKNNFSPADRHEYCVNMMKRAGALGMEMPELIQHYGSEKYASRTEVSVALGARRELLDEKLASLLDKVAELYRVLPPDEFSTVLEEFDKQAGLQQHYDRFVPDPYYSTFGIDKTASGEWSEVIGNDLVTETALKNLALVGHKQLHKLFGEDFAKEFQKEPVEIFKSLPEPQKKMVARMSLENSAGVSPSL